MTPEKKAFYIFHSFYKVWNINFTDAIECSKFLVKETLSEISYWCTEESTKKEQERIIYWNKVLEELERLAQ